MPSHRFTATERDALLAKGEPFVVQPREVAKCTAAYQTDPEILLGCMIVSGSPHPPGYWRTYKRPDPHGLTVHFTQDEYEMLQRRAEKDGTTRHAVAKKLLLNYAKNGLGEG
jgi:hypothetical protein